MQVNRDGVRRSAFDLLAYPEVTIGRLADIWSELSQISPDISEQIEIDAKYAVYLDRQSVDIAAVRRDDGLKIPSDFDYVTLSGLSNEMRHKLEMIRPATIGQASRIEGVTPAALTLVLGTIRREQRRAG